MAVIFLLNLEVIVAMYLRICLDLFQNCKQRTLNRNFWYIIQEVIECISRVISKDTDRFIAKLGFNTPLLAAG